MTEKTVDIYEDAAVVADMRARYTAADTDEARAAVVQELADELEKSPASIRGKLVREGVYVAKTRVGKTGEKPRSKEDLVADLEAIVGSDLETLEKANKRVIQALIAFAREHADVE